MILSCGVGGRDGGNGSSSVSLGWMVVGAVALAAGVVVVAAMMYQGVEDVYGNGSLFFFIRGTSGGICSVR